MYSIHCWRRRFTRIVTSTCYPRSHLVWTNSVRSILKFVVTHVCSSCLVISAALPSPYKLVFPKPEELALCIELTEHSLWWMATTHRIIDMPSRVVKRTGMAQLTRKCLLVERGVLTDVNVHVLSEIVLWWPTRLDRPSASKAHNMCPSE